MWSTHYDDALVDIERRVKAAAAKADKKKKKTKTSYCELKKSPLSCLGSGCSYDEQAGVCKDPPRGVAYKRAEKGALSSGQLQFEFGGFLYGRRNKQQSSFSIVGKATEVHPPPARRKRSRAAVVRSRSSSRRSRSRSASACVRKTTKYYNSSTRKAPPYDASECCGTTKKGNNGRTYVSVQTAEPGKCRWKLSA